MAEFGNSKADWKRVCSWTNLHGRQAASTLCATGRDLPDEVPIVQPPNCPTQQRVPVAGEPLVIHLVMNCPSCAHG